MRLSSVIKDRILGYVIPHYEGGIRAWPSRQVNHRLQQCRRVAVITQPCSSAFLLYNTVWLEIFNTWAEKKLIRERKKLTGLHMTQKKNYKAKNVHMPKNENQLSSRSSH